MRKVVSTFLFVLVGMAGAAGFASGNVEALQGVVITAETMPLLYPYLIGGGLVGGIVGLLLSLIPPILSR